MKYDPLIENIASYCSSEHHWNDMTYKKAIMSFIDSLSCAFLAIKSNQCKYILGPIVPGTDVPLGARVPGTSLVHDPVKAAFDISLLIRWLDYNDTFLGKEWGHPSDNIGAIYAISDYLAKKRNVRAQKTIKMKDTLNSLICAYEIQGRLSLDVSLNEKGFDHVYFVKVASAAASMMLLKNTKENIMNALSHAFADGVTLRTYRHEPNVTSRKSWAAGSASSRALTLAYLVACGEEGLPTVLSDPKWGLNSRLIQNDSVFLDGNLTLDSYVINNILYKIDFPAEYHGQSAVEAGINLHPQVKDCLEDIQSITIETQKPGITIINKSEFPDHWSDRDHCLKYMTTAALIEGSVTYESYHQKPSELFVKLWDKIKVVENKEYSKLYYDPDSRAVANKVTVQTSKDSFDSEVVYPHGHPRFHEQSFDKIIAKFENAAQDILPAGSIKKCLAMVNAPELLLESEFYTFSELMVPDYV